MAKVRKFTVQGIARDQAWISSNQLIVEAYMHEEMRTKGFVPVLDSRSELRWSYNAENDTFDYTISIKAIKIGKRKAKKFRGVMLNQGLLIQENGESELLHP